MNRPRKLSADEEAAADALRALGGLLCTGCKQELNWQTKQLTCSSCGRIHCPVCGKSISARCSHRLAQSARGKWRFEGVVDAQTSVPWLPQDLAFLLEYPIAQMRQAFGSACALLSTLFGEDFTHTPSLSELAVTLADQVAAEGRQYETWPRTGVYHFARDREVTREVARQLLQELQRGFEQLRLQPPAAAAYIERVLSLPPEQTQASRDDAWQWCAGGLQHVPVARPLLRFDTTGTRLACSRHADVWVWKLTEQAPPPCLSHPPEHTLIDIAFAPDGERLEVHTKAKTASRYDLAKAETLWTWDLTTGALLEQRLVPPLRRDFDNSGPIDFLHDGDTVVIVRDATVYLTPLPPELPSPLTPDAFGSMEGALRLDHRTFVKILIVSPDRETFVTTQGDHLIVWRVPRHAVHGAEQQEAT